MKNSGGQNNAAKTNCLREFHQIYNLCAVGDQDELTRY